jgi:hypothetical protein
MYAFDVHRQLRACSALCRACPRAGWGPTSSRTFPLYSVVITFSACHGTYMIPPIGEASTTLTPHGYRRSSGIIFGVKTMATRQRHLPLFALPIVFVGSTHSLTGSFPDLGWVSLKMLSAWEVWPGVFSRVLVAGRMSSSVVPNPPPQSDGQDPRRGRQCR